MRKLWRWKSQVEHLLVYDCSTDNRAMKGVNLKRPLSVYVRVYLCMCVTYVYLDMDIDIDADEFSMLRCSRSLRQVATVRWL